MPSALLGGPCLAQGEPKPTDEAERFVDSLYSDRIAKAQQTRTTDDDLELLREMFDIAPTLPRSPDAQSAMYARLVETALKSRAGYPVALQAIDALTKLSPQHDKAQPQSRLEVYSAWYRSADRGKRQPIAERYFDALVAAADAAIEAGDHASAKRWYSEAGSVTRVNRLDRDFDLRAKLAETRSVERIQEEIDQLAAAADAKTLQPAQARRLVLLMALEMGRFREAARYGTLTEDAELDKGLRAAADLGGAAMDAENADLADGPPAKWFYAGSWLASLIDDEQLSERANLRALVLSRDALRFYVETTRKQDVDRARASILLRDLDERFANLGLRDSNTYNLIAGLDPQQHTLGGRAFSIREDALVLPVKTVVHLPAEGGDHYTLKLKFQIQSERNDGLIVMLPIGDGMARFFLDGAHHRNAKFDGLDYIPYSGKNMLLLEKKDVELEIQVRLFSEEDVLLRVKYNNMKPWQWRGSPEKLTDPPYGKPPDPSHFSLLVGTEAVFSSIVLDRHIADSE